jgi:hypothetical protein
MSAAQSGAACDSTTDDVSAAELATCISVLRRLGSAVEAYPELDALGKDTWRRVVLKERYGEEDVVAFLERTSKHKELLKRLERLATVVHLAHEERVAEAAGCEINAARGEEALMITGAAGQQQAQQQAQLQLSDEQGVIEWSATQRHQLAQDRKLSSGKRDERLRLDEQRKQQQRGSQHAALADPAAGPDAAPMSWVTTREYKRAELAQRFQAPADAAAVAATEEATEEEAEAVLLARAAAAAAIPVCGPLRMHCAKPNPNPNLSPSPDQVGSLRMHCACCKEPYSSRHHFYHQLCPPCASLNFTKRKQSAR